ncbi:MAG TPA: LysR substrate-binding domain-containing protein [Luteimonas sp.]|nr:LysR substrate-binding domain-containing protein [Luteimonas sp.]
MSISSRRLPPLTQLRAFEAAARHCSFKRAAQELSVTPAAISHQVRDLEARLGVLLFERRSREVVPTPQARRLYPVLRDGFDAFADALQSLAPDAADRVVTVSVTPAFATQYLLSRLPDLQRLHPDIELRLHASDGVVDLARGDVDIAVRYGDGPFPGHEAVRFADDRLLPVASAALGLRAPRDLAGHRLIHFEWRRDAERRPTWRDWLRAAGLAHDDASRGPRFSEVAHAIQAAVAGQGVALLNHVLVADALARGVLEAPFGPQLDVPGWTLLRHRDRHAGPARQAVWDWLLGLRTLAPARRDGPMA